MRRRASSARTRTPRDTARLWRARAVAWSLLFGGWTVLGTLGHEAARAGAPPGLPLAVSLASIGLLLALGMRRASSMRVGTGIGIQGSDAIAAVIRGLGKTGCPEASGDASMGWESSALISRTASERSVSATESVFSGQGPGPSGALPLT
jgi:hypothetical protein